MSWINPFSPKTSMAGKIYRWLFIIVLPLAILTTVVAGYEYNKAFKPFFEPVPTMGKDEKGPAPGVVFTNTIIKLTEQMLEGWLPNDRLWPSIFLDNPHNYQMGQLEVIRYGTRLLRDKLSRQRTTDKIDQLTDRAFTDFSNDPYRWMFPSAESKFKDAVKALREYQVGLKKGTSHFYPRADNFIELLDQLTSLLGGFNTRLANAPRDVQVKLSEETAGDRYTSGEKMVKVKVPWREIDDNFYLARGAAYALRQLMVAIRWEFREVIEVKRSGELVNNIIEDLGRAHIEPLLVLNGSRDSIFANHSLTMQATLENVRQKMINLQQMMER